MIVTSFTPARRSTHNAPIVADMRALQRSKSVVLLFVLLTPGNCQNYTCIDQSQVDLSLDLPFLRARFPDVSIKKPTRPPFLGGRNLTYCCLQAVNDYLSNNCTNTPSVNVQHRILDPSAQFSCGASWNGDVLGAPEVLVSYNWTTHYCPGWQLAQASKVNEWAQLLVSFVLPAVVFSFNIPRPRKLKIWESFFPKRIFTWKVLAGIAGAVGSAIIVTVDTVVWLMASFAFAGPLLLSGLFEALLDKKVLSFLEDHIKKDKDATDLPLGLRARMLFTILCGNLDMYPAWSDTMDLARHLDDLDKASPAFASRLPQTPAIQVLPVDHSDDLAATASSRASVRDHSPSSRAAGSDSYSIGSSDGFAHEIPDTKPLRPASSEKSPAFLQVSSADYAKGQRFPVDSLSLQRTISASSVAGTETGSITEIGDSSHRNVQAGRSKTIKKLTVRLRAMLSCQYSFGSTIGGPVVFFLGAFIYALLDLKQNFGDENIAEAIAFGMWWTIIPHVAAVAGLLLAGNNPNILEGIVNNHEFRYTIGQNLVGNSLDRRSTIIPMRAHQEIKSSWQKAYTNMMERVYEAEYTPAWMWDRGKCKQDWLVVLFTDSWLKYQHRGEVPANIRKVLEDFLRKAVILGIKDWAILWIFAFGLLFIPCIFGFLVAYLTPEIGIGCHAMTVLIYMAAQTLLTVLWTYYLTQRDKYWTIAKRVKSIFENRGSQPDADLRDLISDLKTQAERDTMMSSSLKRRLSNKWPVDVEALGPDLVTLKDRAHPYVRKLFYASCIFGCAVSLLTSIGGTLMRVMGVYRNCLCLMNAPDWPAHRRYSRLVRLSTNLSQAIRVAQRDWITLGAINVVFLGVVCYIGWWYQKHLRTMFKKLAGRIDGAHRDREMSLFGPQSTPLMQQQFVDVPTSPRL